MPSSASPRWRLGPPCLRPGHRTGSAGTRSGRPLMSEQGHDAVRKICEHWSTMSLEDLREVMADDCDYRNVPFDGDRHVGPEEAHAILSTMGDKWDIDLTVVNLVGDDRVVMTERTERFARKDGSKEPFVLPVMGVFELRDGKVSAWRDYFERTHLRLR